MPNSPTRTQTAELAASRPIRPPLYQLTLLILSFYVLITLSLEAFVVEDEETAKVLQFIDFCICMLFLAYFFIALGRAPNKLAYLKWGWIDFVSSIPMIDPLRWGRLARIVRIMRILRVFRSFRVIYDSVRTCPLETLTTMTFIVVFFSFSVSASLIISFEAPYSSNIADANSALWWAFLSLMNAKLATFQPISAEGMMTTVVLNKIGLLLFAYFNATIIAWLVAGKKETRPNGGDE